MCQRRCSFWVVAHVCIAVWLWSMPSYALSGSFQRAASGVSRQLRGSPGTYRFRSISRAIFRLDQTIPIAGLHPQRKAIMQGIVACMAAYSIELPYKSRVAVILLSSRYALLRKMYFPKRQIAKLLNHQQRLHRCLNALQRTQAWSRLLAQRVDQRYLRRELRSVSQLIPLVHKAIVRLEAIDKALQFKRKKGQKKLSSKERRRHKQKLLHQAKGLFLQLSALFIRRKQERYKHGPSYAERIEKIRQLWKLRPFHKRAQIVSDMAPLLVHMTFMGVSGLLTFLLAADQVKGGGLNSSQDAAMWGLLGGTLSIGVASPALLLISLPQSYGSSVSISVLSGLFVPAMGISLALSQQHEAKMIGYGILASLPLHATWLIIGWINQARWADQRQRWMQPPPPPAQAPTEGSLSLTVR